MKSDIKAADQKADEVPPPAFLQCLLDAGIIHNTQARLIPLTGGVSSEIYKVEEGSRSFVAKRALSKLKVAADWVADPSRNIFEQAYLRYVSRCCPGAVPRILDARPEQHFFTMEYLEGFQNWKADLLAGTFSLSLAAAAGRILGTIHAASWADSAVARDFDSLENFDQLRIDPYLRATALVHPELASPILAEAERLRTSRQCLMHGDFSPKNMLHYNGRLVILDCEVACHGDAAFDLAFLLNHLLLKGLFHAPAPTPLPLLYQSCHAAYADALGGAAGSVKAAAARLLPMLLLARVDGKSPVEYLSPKKQQHVRTFTMPRILQPPDSLEALSTNWFDGL